MITQNVVCLLWMLLAASSPWPSGTWDGPPGEQTEGRFWRYHVYERGIAHGNPAYTPRFRINSPEASVTPGISSRVEARENGLMLIRCEEDVLLLSAAELCTEMWGGHPGTANKRVTINGRSTYALARVGTEEEHCTYFYPALSLKQSDLVNGYNAFQFALDQGTASWGHAMIDAASLRVALVSDHPDLKAAGLEEFRARVEATPNPEADSESEGGFRLALECPAERIGDVESVEYQGWYEGYDENGNRESLDWHGFTKRGQPQARLGVARERPFAVSWDTSMLPAQRDVAVRAVVRFRKTPALVYLTAATRGLEIPERRAARVVWVSPDDLPDPFWSRANHKKQCSLVLGVDPSRIERAELHVVTWTGGAGSVREYFKLNGVHYAVAEGATHEPRYSRLPVDPKSLRRGANLVELLSDTEHHGIEVLAPGPALMLRCRAPAVEFRRATDRVDVTIAGEAVATYVHEDPEISRPYFAHLRVPGGPRVSRNHPPEADDFADHATMHPGLWLAFGDLGGRDYWRLKARVRHEGFVEEAGAGANDGGFAVHNVYLAEDGVSEICRETCRYTFLPVSHGYLILWDSELTAQSDGIAFGDQEEMGLGVRVDTSLAVKSGKGGRILDAEGRRDEAQVWGTQAPWCDYGGPDGGVTLMPHPDNFRPSWYHARDYGLLVANAFGRRAMKAGAESRVVLEKGKPFRLRYGIFVHGALPRGAEDIRDAYELYVKGGSSQLQNR